MGALRIVQSSIHEDKCIVVVRATKWQEVKLPNVLSTVQELLANLGAK